MSSIDRDKLQPCQQDMQVDVVIIGSRMAGGDKDKLYLFYVTVATGLPIVAALGKYSVDNLIDGNRDFDIYFSPYRKFPISSIAQSILGNKLTFAISNMIKTNIL